MRNNPLLEATTEPSRMLVAVPTDPRDLECLEPLVAELWTPEGLALGERVAYMWCRDGVLVSRVLEAVGRALGTAVTMRNWATLTKIHALLGSG
ncbi:MAG TPA: hypothetical protein VNB06_14800 [Thermoanaerobaculia bacterium]|nr:hypothetical protein [Thermoanaerobaculia bacterium]